jgi:hypothetical protein
MLNRMISGSSQRDRLLALGAACAAVAFLLLTASQALVLRDVLRLQFSITFRYELGHVLRVFSALALSFAFGLAAWGLVSDGASRSRRLGAALVTAAIAFLAAAVAVALVYWQFVQYHYLHVIGTSALTSFLSGLGFAVAAAAAAVAFLGMEHLREGWRNPPALIHRACLILAAAFVLLAAADGLYGVYWGSSSYIPSIVSPSDLFLAGFWVAAGGNLILAAGAMIAGVAFSRWTDRDERLSLAATIFALGFLLVAVGKTLSQIDDPNIEPSGVAGWLDAAQAYVLVIAMACGAAGVCWRDAISNRP